jgi:high affinity Mn2+ porin
MRGFVAAVGLVALTVSANAADPSASLPVKAPPQPAEAKFDWTGFYAGVHYGYAGGSSHWSAMQTGVAAVPGLSGSLDMFKAFDAFSGTGSYLHGLQAGYNYMLPSRMVVGAEADVSFPSQLAGSVTFSSPSSGTATYQDLVEFSGTVRARIGYASGNSLFYATGGLAYSYDQLTRTQLSGMPAGGTALPGTVDNRFLVPRFGAAVGAGVELALTSKWMARLEFLYTDYGSRSVAFPDAAESFKSNLNVATLRAGLDYKLGQNGIDAGLLGKGVAPLDLGWFAVHGETTFIEQYVPPFHAPYRGANSLIPNQGREAGDLSLSAGFKLWQGAEFWVDPEIDQGFGVSNTEGVAGYVNGAAAKVGAAVPYARLPRYLVRQTIDLGGKSEKVDGVANQFAGSQTENRIVFTVGKFAATDIFDKNKYATDPRNDFLNWALIDTGTFDYAADAWGYSYGAAAEWYQGDWTVRGGLFDLSIVPNSAELDPSFGEFQWLGEIERRYQLWGHPGKIAVTGFLSRGRMGTFADAIALAQMTGAPADIVAVRQYRSRPGVSANLEQEIISDLGVFARVGWADGNVEPYEYADIDRTAAAGLQLKGTQWGRPDDTVGVAGAVNGISKEHEAYLNAGGLGILVGDGMLPHPGLETIIEAYYSYALTSAAHLSLDYQFIDNPAYNTDRGPAHVFGGRFHWQF